MMFTLNELYLTRINGNVDMRCRAIKQSPIRRSGSTVVGNEKDGISHQSLNVPCEVTQSQRIKKATALFKRAQKPKRGGCEQEGHLGCQFLTFSQSPSWRLLEAPAN